MQYEFWRHKTSGEIYAVAVELELVDAAYGPLNYADMAVDPSDILDVQNDPDTAAWINADPDQYRLVEQSQIDYIRTIAKEMQVNR